jgi:hypothetical protein
MFKRYAICAFACQFLIAFFVHIDFASADTKMVRPFAVGAVFYTDNWDHTVVKLKNGEQNEKYFVLFTHFLEMSRALGKTTSLRITTQVYEVVNGGFRLVRDEKVAKDVFERGEILPGQNVAARPAGSSCDFLSRRFWPFNTKKTSGSDWYFLRLSSRLMPSGFSSNWGCQNLDGENNGQTQVTAGVPFVYDVGDQTIFIDAGFPIAILASPNEPVCIVGSFPRTKAKPARILHLFDNRPMPEILASELLTSRSVLSFNSKLHEIFNSVWSQLTEGKSCLTYESTEFDSVEFLDSERKYVRETMSDP